MSKLKKSKSVFVGFLKFTAKTLTFLVIVSAIIINSAYFILGDFRSYVFQYPELTGFDNESRNYLIVFQNDYELRPTGGFVTAYGILSFENGKYKDLDINDIYTLSEPSPNLKPPYPMEKFLKGDFDEFPLYFRDANYSADFPTSTKRLIDIFHENKPTTRIDGVVSVNFSFIEGLAKVLDGIEEIVFEEKKRTDFFHLRKPGKRGALLNTIFGFMM